MNFKTLLLRAKANEPEALEQLIQLYRPMLLKESTVDGIFDEDLYQELCITLLHCIETFPL